MLVRSASSSGTSHAPTASSKHSTLHTTIADTLLRCCMRNANRPRCAHNQQCTDRMCQAQLASFSSNNALQLAGGWPADASVHAAEQPYVRLTGSLVKRSGHHLARTGNSRCSEPGPLHCGALGFDSPVATDKYPDRAALARVEHMWQFFLLFVSFVAHASHDYGLSHQFQRRPVGSKPGSSASGSALTATFVVAADLMLLPS
jgi:hypothetical protein